MLFSILIEICRRKGFKPKLEIEINPRHRCRKTVYYIKPLKY
jgi:hypothetical protein